METGNNDGLDTTLEKNRHKMFLVNNCYKQSFAKYVKNVYINTLKEQKRLKIDVRNFLI